jgi:aspartyl-tRNA(Asn)/glutamyl-tRNA(Gln) amidotransferase subunit C
VGLGRETDQGHKRRGNAAAAPAVERPPAGFYPAPSRFHQKARFMSLDHATVRRIASLARIRVEEDEIPRLQTELNSILGWIEQLNAVNVEGVEPLTGATHMALKMREDVVTDGGYPDQILANAPDRAGAFFAVPKVVE